MLADSRLTALFYTQCEREFASENLCFYLEVARLQDCEEGAALAEASLRIYHKYVRTDSSTQVNITDSDRTEIERRVLTREYGLDMYRSAHADVLNMLLSGPLQRFLAKTKRLVFTSQVCMVDLPLARSTLRGQRHPPQTQEGIDSPGLHELVRAFQKLEGYEILVRPNPSCALARSTESTGCCIHDRDDAHEQCGGKGAVFCERRSWLQTPGCVSVATTRH